MGASTKTSGNYNASGPDDFLTRAVQGTLDPQQAPPPASGMNPTPAMPQMQVPMNSNPAGKGGSSYTFSNQSGQPKMGVPNSYANTIGSGDNSLNPQPLGQGKGKGS
jgi:hypothetical protein